MKYQCVADSRHEFPVAMMCRMLRVKPSGFYAWLRRPPSRRSQENDRLRKKITEIHAESDGGSAPTWTSCWRWQRRAVRFPRISGFAFHTAAHDVQVKITIAVGIFTWIFIILIFTWVTRILILTWIT